MSTIKDCVAPNAALNSLASYDRTLVNASLFSNVLEPTSPVALSCNDVIDNADKLSYPFHKTLPLKQRGVIASELVPCNVTKSLASGIIQDSYVCFMLTKSSILFGGGIVSKLYAEDVMLYYTVKTDADRNQLQSSLNIML